MCTIMRFFYNFNTMHPEKKGVVLIDYSLVAIMMPTTIAGSQVGAIVLKTFPAMMIQVFLTILLGGLTYQSYRKAKELHLKEQLNSQIEMQTHTTMTSLNGNSPNGSSREMQSTSYMPIQE